MRKSLFFIAVIAFLCVAQRNSKAELIRPEISYLILIKENSSLIIKIKREPKNILLSEIQGLLEKALEEIGYKKVEKTEYDRASDKFKIFGFTEAIISLKIEPKTKNPEIVIWERDMQYIEFSADGEISHQWVEVNWRLILKLDLSDFISSLNPEGGEK